MDFVRRDDVAGIGGCDAGLHLLDDPLLPLEGGAVLQSIGDDVGERLVRAATARMRS